MKIVMIKLFKSMRKKRTLKFYENNYRFKQAIGEDYVYSVPARYNMGISIALSNNGRE